VRVESGNSASGAVGTAVVTIRIVERRDAAREGENARSGYD
jgi:hypothetical protein